MGLKTVLGVVVIAVWIGVFLAPATREAHDGPRSARAPEPNFFKNQQGLWIYTRSWLAASPKASVFISHGFGEHCGRYNELATFLNKNNYNVYSMDHQGHGQSEGDRAHVVHADDYIDDFFSFVNNTSAAFPKNHKVFLIGHSMGGLIALLTAHRAPTKWAGVVLSGPAIVPDPNIATPTMIFIATVLSDWLPKLPVEALRSNAVSRDPDVLARYDSDPLVYHGRMRTRWGRNMLQNMEKARETADKIDWPILLLHGGNDTLCLPEGSQLLYDKAVSKDKTLLVYPGLYHEVFQEPEKEKVFGDVLNWFNKH